MVSRWQANGLLLEVENPYTEEVIASVGSAGDEQVDAAIAAAREAARDWAPDAGGRPGRAPA